MRKLTLLVLVLFVQNIFALQMKQLRETEKLEVQISETSLNRISVVEDRIAQVFGLNEDLIIETDEDTGQIFLRVKQNKPIDLSLITEKKVTIDLRLIPKKIPGETIIIKSLKPVMESKTNAKANNYVEEITTLIMAMANAKTLPGFSAAIVNKEISLWDDIEIKETHEYVGTKLIGEIYSITNKTLNTIVLTETQFGWQKGIAAVTLKKKALAPQEETKIYLVRHSI